MNLKNALNYAQNNQQIINEESTQFLIGVSLDTEYDFSILSVQFEGEDEYLESGWVGRVITSDISSRKTYEDYLYEVSNKEFCLLADAPFAKVEFHVYTLGSAEILDSRLEDILFSMFPFRLPNPDDVETHVFVDLARSIIQEINSKSSEGKLQIVC